MSFWTHFAMNTRWICIVLAIVMAVCAAGGLISWWDSSTEASSRTLLHVVYIFIALTVALLLGFAALDAYSETHTPPPQDAPSFFSFPCGAPVLERAP